MALNEKIGTVGNKREFLLLLILSFFFLSQTPHAVSSNLNCTMYTRPVSNLKLERIQRHLEKINKPPVLTIESPDGDIIDCVHKRKQPALDHPLLKNHKIQKAPSELPKMTMVKTDDMRDVKRSSKYNTSSIIGQLWHQNGQRCPEGTVPIRRTRVDDILRAKSLNDFGKKHRHVIPLLLRVDDPYCVVGTGHEHASAPMAAPEIYGAKATINVWDPAVEVAKEFSLSQIWVMAGSSVNDINTIEAGWQVFPELYGDRKPRLFIYWTSDGYHKKGCYNLLCAGFVQTNKKIAIGGAISSVSSVDGNQYDVTIFVWKDRKQGNWWMSFDNTVVGYWPAQLFTHLADRATIVDWGGEVVNSRAYGVHTSTDMGSGHFAADGFRKASYFKNLEIVGSDNKIKSAQGIKPISEAENCYTIQSSYNKEWGTHFYYGGPGRNPKCM